MTDNHVTNGHKPDAASFHRTALSAQRVAEQCARIPGPLSQDFQDLAAAWGALINAPTFNLDAMRDLELRHLRLLEELGSDG